MELEQIVESLIFASPDGVSAREIARVVTNAGQAAVLRLTEEAAIMTKQAAELESEDAPALPVDISQVPSDPMTDLLVRYAEVTEEEITEAILALIQVYQDQGRAFTLAERPTGWRITARAEYAPWVRQLFPEKKAPKLSPGALETLAIIAYRQPVTRASLEAVRGVSVDGPVQTLLDRNIIRIAGRADLPGRPLLYETTDLFLEHFGVKSVDDLPNAAELRSVQLPDADLEIKEPEPKEVQGELALESKKAKRKPKEKTEESTPPEAPVAAEPSEAEPVATFVYEAPEEEETTEEEAEEN